MVKKEKPLLDKRIFWDVNFDSIDYDNYAPWVIVRVFERGDVNDIRNCREYYAEEVIRKALTNEKFLRKETVYLACAVLENQLTDYKCYNLAQLNPEHWLY